MRTVAKALDTAGNAVNTRQSSMRFGMITDRRISGGSTHLLERRTRQPSDDATGPAMKTSISGYLCRAELIRFSHGLPRSAPLTWSQRGWLARVLGEHVDPSDLAASRHIYVDGLAVDAVLPRLRQLVERFEALRTSFVIDGLEDSVQQVAAERSEEHTLNSSHI